MRKLQKEVPIQNQLSEKLRLKTHIIGLRTFFASLSLVLYCKSIMRRDEGMKFGQDLCPIDWVA